MSDQATKDAIERVRWFAGREGGTIGINAEDVAAFRTILAELDRLRKPVEDAEVARIVLSLRGLDWVAGPVKELACQAADFISRLARERDEGLPWKLFYKDGLNLKQVAERLGLKSQYELSPWLYAPLMRCEGHPAQSALLAAEARVQQLEAALRQIAASKETGLGDQWPEHGRLAMWEIARTALEAKS